MDQPPAQPAVPAAARPTAVTVLSIVYALAGGLGTALSGLVFLMRMLVTRPMTSRMRPGPVEHAEKGFAAVQTLMEWQGPILLTQAVLSAFVLVTAFFLWRCRRWARTALEAVTWTTLLLYLLYTVWFTFFWTGVVGEIASGRGQHGPPAELITMFRVMGPVVAVTTALFYGAPMAVCIHFLRRPNVRAACTK